MLIGRFMIVLAASAVACAVTALGILVISRYPTWSREQSAYFISFAAGVLITVSFMHIIPESMQRSEHAPLFMLLGFLGLYLLNRFLNLYLCHEYECEYYAVGIVPILGIGLHSFIDGAIYAITFNVSIFTGALAAIGMIFHEFPEGIITFVLLERGGFSRERSMWYAFLAAALSTPLGAAIAYPFVQSIDQTALGALLALSAGALVYVGATHLLPEVEEQGKRTTMLALAAGVLVGVVIIASKG
jgi:zinc transporter ZupT